MRVFDFNFTNLYLIPAPWRVPLQNREDILNDWENGKDFKIVDGPYCSIS